MAAFYRSCLSLLSARRKDRTHEAAHELTGDAPPDPLGYGLAGVFVGQGLQVAEDFREGVELSPELAEGHFVVSFCFVPSAIIGAPRANAQRAKRMAR